MRETEGKSKREEERTNRDKRAVIGEGSEFLAKDGVQQYFKLNSLHQFITEGGRFSREILRGQRKKKREERMLRGGKKRRRKKEKRKWGEYREGREVPVFGDTEPLEVGSRGN